MFISAYYNELSHKKSKKDLKADVIQVFMEILNYICKEKEEERFKQYYDKFMLKDARSVTKLSLKALRGIEKDIIKILDSRKTLPLDHKILIPIINFHYNFDSLKIKQFEFKADTFYIHRLEIIYDFVLIGIFVIVHRYLIYSLKYAKEQYIKDLSKTYDTVLVLAVRPKRSLVFDFDADFEFDLEKMVYHLKRVTLEEFIEIRVKSLIGPHADLFEYDGDPLAKDDIAYKYGNTSFPVDLTAEDDDVIYKELNNVLPKLLELSLSLEIYSRISSIPKIRYVKALAYSLYFTCWTYILTVSFHKVLEFSITNNVVKWLILILSQVFFFKMFNATKFKFIPLLFIFLIYLTLNNTPTFCEELVDLTCLIQKLNEGLMAIIQQPIVREYFNIKTNMPCQIYDYFYLQVMQEFITTFVNSEKCLAILLDRKLSSDAVEKKILDLFFYEFAEANDALATKIIHNIIVIGVNPKLTVMAMSSILNYICANIELLHELYFCDEYTIITLNSVKTEQLVYYNLLINNVQSLNNNYSIHIEFNPSEICLCMEISFVSFKFVIYKVS